MKPKCAIISINAQPEFRSLRYGSTAPFRDAHPFAETFHQGNIYRDDFWEVWEHRFEPFRNREWARQGECANCKMFRYCLGGGMHLHDDDGQLLYCHYRKL